MRQWICLYLCHLKKIFEIQQLDPSLLQTEPVTVYKVMSFLDKTIFAPMDIHNLSSYVGLFRMTC